MNPTVIRSDIPLKVNYRHCVEGVISLWPVYDRHVIFMHVQRCKKYFSRFSDIKSWFFPPLFALRGKCVLKLN